MLKLILLFTAPTAFPKAQLLTLLIKAFEYKTIDTSEFFFTIDAEHIYCSIPCYETQVESSFAVIKGVCFCCGLFIWLLLLVIVLRSNTVVVATLNNYIINLTCFDYCN